MRALDHRTLDRRAMRLERLRRYEDLIKRDGPDSIWVDLRDIDREIAYQCMVARRRHRP